MKDDEPAAAGNRVATQNLLLGAQKAADGRAEVWADVEDLAALVDAAVLQDRLIFLARGDGWRDHAAASDFGSFLLDSGLVASTVLSDELSATVAEEAAGHLATFLGISKAEQHHELTSVALTPQAAYAGLNMVPDRWDDFDIGRRHLRQLAEGDWEPATMLQTEDPARGTTFLVRSFLYVAYANSMRRPLLSDASRRPAFEMLAMRHSKLVREKAIAGIADADKVLAPDPAEPAFNSPFASLVFARCEWDLSRLADVTAQLRIELEPARLKLVEIERLAYGSQVEAQRGMYLLNELEAELARNFGPHGSRRTWPNMLDLAEGVADVVEKPQSPATWVAFIAMLPFQTLKQWWRRRPLVEIHRLRDELPGSEQRIGDVQRLFGLSQNSGPSR